MTKQTRTVLILDDDEAIRRSLVDHFEDRDWRALPAETAEDALKMLEYEDPDGAIVDIRLPGMDGNAFILQAHRLKPEMAFVIATGSPAYRPPEKVLALPCVSRVVFAKPIRDLSDLEATLCILAFPNRF
ncbi:MAG: response regulator [Proteobacteria bacterium]|nr:response regulator [Pseudomonadota bacterium]